MYRVKVSGKYLQALIEEYFTQYLDYNIKQDSLADMRKS